MKWKGTSETVKEKWFKEASKEEIIDYVKRKETSMGNTLSILAVLLIILMYVAAISIALNYSRGASLEKINNNMLALGNSVCKDDGRFVSFLYNTDKELIALCENKTFNVKETYDGNRIQD